MDEVEVFSKNAAVRNAPWWDKLYISRRGVFGGSLISDASRLTRPSAHALHFQHSWRPLMFAYLFLARPKGTRSRHPSLTQGKPLVYHLRADRTPLRL